MDMIPGRYLRRKVAQAINPPVTGIKAYQLRTDVNCIGQSINSLKMSEGVFIEDYRHAVNADLYFIRGN